MTPSHITRKKIVSWLYFLPGYMWGCHGFISFLIICEGVMSLFSSWLYVRLSWLYFLPGPGRK
jgi:hypothetical protein